MQTSTKLVPREIDKTITYGRIYKMKKLLGILVLGLLWCSNTYAGLFSKDKIKVKECYDPIEYNNFK